MNASSAEHERTTRIRNAAGLHARPAAEFVKLANEFDAEISVTKEETRVNGKSIMGVLMLAAEHGSEITIHANGADAERAVEQLTAMVEGRFEEE